MYYFDFLRQHGPGTGATKSEARTLVLPVWYLMTMNRSLNLFRCQFHPPWKEDNNNNFLCICFDISREKVLHNSKCCNSTYFVSSIWGKRENPAACSVLMQGVCQLDHISKTRSWSGSDNLCQGLSGSFIQHNFPEITCTAWDCRRVVLTSQEQETPSLAVLAKSESSERKRNYKQQETRGVFFPKTWGKFPSARLREGQNSSWDSHVACSL